MISVSICEQDFDIGQHYQAVCEAAPQAGAVVFFVGLVRDLYGDGADDERVSHIELQHYAGMTEQLCQEICEQAQQRFELDAVRVVHRVGELHAGDQIVFVAAAARHRRPAGGNETAPLRGPRRAQKPCGSIR